MAHQSLADGVRRDPAPEVLGVDVDYQTRCEHYHSSRDIVAIQFRCCGKYYACRECHDALAGHVAELWPMSEWETPAVFCGVCRTELTIQAYLECSDRYPHCSSAFNPGCRKHRHLYFDKEESGEKHISPETAENY